MEAVRIGVLGAAHIVPQSLIKPGRQVAEATVYGVAARDEARARTFAHKHHIPHVFASYDELLAEPQIDAVYIPLPNSLHEQWTLRALDAGKHVLCEKPFASNTAEAERMAEAAQQSGLVLMEAFHYRYHRLMARMKEIIASGELGTLRRIDASLCFPLLSRNDIRYNLSLSGGQPWTLARIRSMSCAFWLEKNQRSSRRWRGWPHRKLIVAWMWKCVFLAALADT